MSTMILLAKDDALRAPAESLESQRPRSREDIQHTLVGHVTADVIEQHHLGTVGDGSRGAARIDQQLSSPQLSRYDSHPCDPP